VADSARGAQNSGGAHGKSSLPSTPDLGVIINFPVVISAPPMPTEIKKEIELEIANVLFIDIVGYSKLLIDEQRDYLHTLNEVVRETDPFRAAEAAGKLTRLPTGDRMALVFATTPDAPVSCALQLYCITEVRLMTLRAAVADL
jgi:hypothetical protein